MTSTTWLTLREAAGLARVSSSTLYAAVQRGEVRHSRLSGRRTIRIRPDAIEEWLLRFERPAQLASPTA